jgi:hypothetical protein
MRSRAQRDVRPPVMGQGSRLAGSRGPARRAPRRAGGCPVRRQSPCQNTLGSKIRAHVKNAAQHSSSPVAGSQLACHSALVGGLDRHTLLAVANRAILDSQRPGVQAANRHNTGSVRPDHPLTIESRWDTEYSPTSMIQRADGLSTCSRQSVGTRADRRVPGAGPSRRTGGAPA